jgi:magnesium chelatase family protein
VTCNAHVPGAVLRERRWRLPVKTLSLAERFLDRGQLTARGFDRVLRIAWTTADLNGHDSPGPDDVAEALFLRMGMVAA